ncbi:hypothetical protein SAMN04488030_2607 [Aliiroseovarius halocynthiae]|uniref:hypothetical protein n=1 Tax=Aliiroseovarius halocynthiae TaxID=985055 RepID=UPI00163DBC87|nr:hypothetical protein [Aliiroseovarius halocynthiae]SMR82260.1 hypothetical protein SAMN04488030_2607 [Aliiroseovarius halocynthiae]
MNANRKPAEILKAPNGCLTFSRADQAQHARLDLSRHDLATLEKVGFAVDALNRWHAFVQSVEQVESLISRYEQATLPVLGGAQDD